MRIEQCKGYRDARAERYFDLFPSLAGQITVSLVAPRQASGWHRHLRQTDRWFVARGRLKIATVDDAGGVEEHVVVGPAAGEVVTIPPGIWHGWRSYDDEVVLVYYLDHKHDETDEVRATEAEILERYGYHL
jgi:dTDP-4-dehydrorhamnose 3,5-epimerase-like enzyme